jgi:hypothetical protein
MKAMTWQTLLPFLPSTVAVTILGFFIRFFGKTVADQIPYSDNRDWSVELSGLWFFVDFLFPPIIIAGAFLLYFRNAVMTWFGQISVMLSPISYHWVNLAIIFIAWLYYAGASVVLVQERYKIPDTTPNSDDPAAFSERRKRQFNWVTKVNAVLLQPSVMLLFFIAGAEALSGSVLWITVFAVQLFAALVGVALNYSLMRYRFPTVNIHFATGKESLTDVLLLKLNPDNVRVRDRERVLIINRSVLSEIEFIDAKQKPETNRHTVPFVAWIPWLLALDAFWGHRLGLGLLIGLVIPGIWAAIAIALGKRLPGVKKIPQQLDPDKAPASVDAAVKSMPTSTIIACIGSVIGSIGTIIGAIGAWQHSLGILVWLGVVVPFIAWALLQIAGLDGLLELLNAIKNEGSKTDGV